MIIIIIVIIIKIIIIIIILIIIIIIIRTTEKAQLKLYLLTLIDRAGWVSPRHLPSFFY